VRALVIAPQPFFSPRGTPFSVYYRTLVMARLGVEIDLLTYGEGKDVDIPGVRIVRIPRFSFLGPVKIGPSILKGFLDVFMALWTLALLLRRRYHWVHAHEEAIFWCRLLKPFMGFRLVYDMHSSLPQQLSNFGFSRSRLLAGVFGMLERTCLKASDGVVTICPELRDYALGVGVLPARHLLIENSLFDDVRLVETAETREAAEVDLGGGPGRVRIVYAGTFEPYQGIEHLIRAVALVRREQPEVGLLLVGGAPAQVEHMKALARDCGVEGACLFTGQVSKRKAAAYVATADILVSPRREGMNTPLKVYEQLASGKPLVATNIRAHTQILTDDVCVLVDPTPEALAKGIISVVADPERARRVAAAARALYEREYSREAYEHKVRQLIRVVA
jgi:glycosyltransferase involved in cell wall biosynthesis